MMAANHAERTAKRARLKPVSSVGHGQIKRKRIGITIMREVQKNGHSFISVDGHRKRVTKGNIKKDSKGYYVEWYRRSDTHMPALRNYARDRARKARHRAMKGRAYTGD